MVTPCTTREKNHHGIGPAQQDNWSTDTYEACAQDNDDCQCTQQRIFSGKKKDNQGFQPDKNKQDSIVRSLVC